MSTGRIDHAQVTVAGDLWVIGGVDSQQRLVMTMQRFRTSAGTWDAPRPIPYPCVACAAAALAGRIYVIGGFVGLAPDNRPTVRVQIYDTATGMWSAGADLPAARYGLSAVAADGRIWALGGGDDRFVRKPEVWSYNPAADAWTPKTPMRTGRKEFATAVGSDGRIYAIGGLNSARSVEAYTVSTDSWLATASIPQGRRGHCAARGQDGRIYVAGGSTDANITTTRVYALNTAQNSWVRRADLPEVRVRPGCSRGGDGALYLTGGFNQTSVTAGMLRYN